MRVSGLSVDDAGTAALVQGGETATREDPIDGPPKRQLAFALLPEEHDLRQRESFRVRDGQQRRLHSHALGTRGRAAVQPQLRRPRHTYYLDVLPEHTARVTGAERLHTSFLGREAAGEVRDGVAPPLTIGNLAVGEDAAQETIAVALQRLRDARDVRRVEPDSNDVHDSAPA